MAERFWLTMSWLFCVTMGVLARYVVSALLGVWGADGSLRVHPWIFAIVDGLPIFVAGALFVYIFCCPDDFIPNALKE